MGPGEFRDFFVRWVPIGVLVGIGTGTLVSIIHLVVYDQTWLPTRQLYGVHPWLVFIVPPTAFLLTAAFVRATGRYSHGTEEVLSAYHTPGAQLRSRPFLRRSLASWATIGSGGSAGLEGPAILTGAWFASWFVRRVKLWNFEEEDRRVLILVGAAAGVAAIFRAPFTGLLFSLEVPYKTDLAKNAFVPGLLASATSYLTFATLVNPTPIFPFTAAEPLKVPDLAWVLLIGVATGILAWAFVSMNRLTRSVFRNAAVPWELGALTGGLLVGAIGFVAIEIYGEPVSMGPGYDAIAKLLTAPMEFKLLFAFLILKVLSTLFTLGTYGVGGIFFQSFLIGGLVGGSLHAALTLIGYNLGPSNLFVTAGMAGFLAASYKTPITATAFVAEGTGSPHYIVPAFVAAAVSYVVSGSTSISEGQVTVGRTRYDVLEGLSVRDAMQTGVVTVPSNLTIDAFLNDWVLRYRHVAYPVTTEGQLSGWITLEHASAFPPEARKLATVADGMSKKTPLATPDEPLLTVLRRMQQTGDSRVLVVDRLEQPRLLGILAEVDLLRLVELRSKGTGS